MDIGTIGHGLIGLGAASAALPIVAQMSLVDADKVASNVATRGTPYILAFVIVVLCLALYKVFGLFLSKVQEREDDMKGVIRENTAALHRMVDHCQRKL